MTTQLSSEPKCNRYCADWPACRCGVESFKEDVSAVTEHSEPVYRSSKTCNIVPGTDLKTGTVHIATLADGTRVLCRGDLLILWRAGEQASMTGQQWLDCTTPETPVVDPQKLFNEDDLLAIMEPCVNCRVALHQLRRKRAKPREADYDFSTPGDRTMYEKALADWRTPKAAETLPEGLRDPLKVMERVRELQDRCRSGLGYQGEFLSETQCTLREGHDGPHAYASDPRPTPANGSPNAP